MKTRDTYGTPYSVDEARAAVKVIANPYHRDLMRWLIGRVDELAAATNAACLIASQRNGQWAREAMESAYESENVEPDTAVLEVGRDERRTDEQIAHLRRVVAAVDAFDPEKVR